jgi:hypothetical protein
MVQKLGVKMTKEQLNKVCMSMMVGNAIDDDNGYDHDDDDDADASDYDYGFRYHIGQTTTITND